MKRKIIPAYFVLGWLLRLGCHSLKCSLIFRYLSWHACIKKCKLSRPHGGQTESLNFIHTCFDDAIKVIIFFLTIIIIAFVFKNCFNRLGISI